MKHDSPSRHLTYTHLPVCSQSHMWILHTRWPKRRTSLPGLREPFMWILLETFKNHLGLPGGWMVKNPPANAGDAGDRGSIPGSGGSPGEGNGKSLQYSCLEIPWAVEPSGLQSTGLQRVRHDWATEHTHTQESFWSYPIVSKALILETVVKRLRFLVVIIEVMPRAQNTPTSVHSLGVGWPVGTFTPPPRGPGWATESSVAPSAVAPGA